MTISYYQITILDFMSDFFTAFTDPNLSFLRYALIAGVLSSLAFGVIGSFVVAKRISYLAGGISHSILAGIGLSLFLQVNYNAAWFSPIIGAVCAGLISALIIGWISLKGRQREDTVIGAVWALGMAAGLIFLAKTPGYIDPMSFLFGNILLISLQDVWLIIGLDVLTITLTFIFYPFLMAVCFDEEYARIKGLKVEFYYLLLLTLIALTVVLLIRVVGIVLVIALLTLPPAIAGLFARKLWQMMVYAVIGCLIFILLGMWLSYNWNLPSGPTIILIAGTIYIIIALSRRWFN